MIRFGMVCAAVVAAVTLWADGPTIVLHRAQQRYPWNGMVDFDYTVSGVPSGHEQYYYVRFTITEHGNPHVLHAFDDGSMLNEASNGTWRVTWNSEWEDDEYRFYSTDAGVKAELIYAADDRTCRPYGDRYLIVDLTKGVSATAEDRYPTEVRYAYDLATATNMFSASEYRTTKMVFREVRAGTFIMGSPQDEPNRQASSWMNRETRHEVTLTNNFLLGIFEVTQAQYYRVMGETPAQHNKSSTSACPVEYVNYATIRGSSAGCAVPPNFGAVDGSSFMGKLSTRTGLVFDLPSEAQWEYACRAGTTTMTYAGDSSVSPNEICWNYANAGGTTHEVGTKLPNAWGFFDMLGNVWEICRDRVTAADGDNFGYATSVVSIPLQIEPVRAVSDGNVSPRGGAFDCTASAIRAAIRSGNGGTAKVDGAIGFRAACMLR